MASSDHYSGPALLTHALVTTYAFVAHFGRIPDPYSLSYHWLELILSLLLHATVDVLVAWPMQHAAWVVTQQDAYFARLQPLVKELIAAVPVENHAACGNSSVSLPVDIVIQVLLQWARTSQLAAVRAPRVCRRAWHTPELQRIATLARTWMRAQVMQRVLSHLNRADIIRVYAYTDGGIPTRLDGGGGGAGDSIMYCYLQRLRADRDDMPRSFLTSRAITPDEWLRGPPRIFIEGSRYMSPHQVLEGKMRMHVYCDFDDGVNVVVLPLADAVPRHNYPVALRRHPCLMCGKLHGHPGYLDDGVYPVGVFI